MEDFSYDERQGCLDDIATTQETIWSKVETKLRIKPTHQSSFDNVFDMMLAQMYKWNKLSLSFQVSGIPLCLHNKVIKDLKEYWDEFLTLHRFRWEKMDEEIKEL